MKQDKDREVVIMDKIKYRGKCLALFITSQFAKLNRDPTKKIETKILGVLRKIKWNISLKEYSRLYPTGSSPDKFYGTAKIHKLSPTHSMEKLPVRRIVSNSNLSFS